jgi:hypothetical protein
MKKSAVLFTALAAAMFPFHASAAENSVDVHVTISQDQVVLDQDITVTDTDGDGRLTSTDALRIAHDLYFPGGAPQGCDEEMGFIWGLRGEYFFSNYSAGETTDPELHNPPEKRRDLKDGDRLFWEAGHMYTEAYIPRLLHPEQYLVDSAVPQGTEVIVIVDHLIPNQQIDDPGANMEITLNGEKTGIFTDGHGWATVPLNKAGGCEIGVASDALGIPSDAVCYVNVTPAQNTAENAVKPTDTAVKKASGAEANAVTKQSANASVSYYNAAETPKAAVRTEASQSADTTPGIIIGLISAGMAALIGALFTVIRKIS